MKRLRQLPEWASVPGQTTPERLVEAVERLLAERDDLEPSLREITSAAGANLAAVNYHFGSKDDLVTAVIERALTDHAREQLAGLEAVARAEPPAGLEEIVRAWIRPSVPPAEGGRPALIARVAARVVSGCSPELRKLAAATHREACARLFELLSGRLPGVPADELAMRLTLVTISIAGMIVGGFDHAASASSTPVAHDNQSAGRAVAFLVGGLMAPSA